MRAEEMATLYDSTFTKKEATLTGKRMVYNLLEEGNVDKFQFATNIIRLQEVINAAVTELRCHLPEEKMELNGVTFTPANGGNTINYSDDIVWQELKSQLSHRESL